VRANPDANPDIDPFADAHTDLNPDIDSFANSGSSLLSLLPLPARSPALTIARADGFPPPYT